MNVGSIGSEHSLLTSDLRKCRNVCVLANAVQLQLTLVYNVPLQCTSNPFSFLLPPPSLHFHPPFSF